ncbi:MAG: DUF2007 domain-containing protein [Flavobacteriales bacterium]|nr:DUF2007 domain-containing protein [Flavobacteriales bacterium]
MSNWVIVYKTNDPNQSQIVKSVLEDNEIDVVLIDKMDSMHKHLMNAEVELHVNPENVIKAKYIISKNSL